MSLILIIVAVYSRVSARLERIFLIVPKIGGSTMTLFYYNNQNPLRFPFLLSGCRFKKCSFFSFLVMVTHPRPPSVARSKRGRKMKFSLRHGKYYVIHWQPTLTTRYRCMDFGGKRVVLADSLKKSQQIEILVRS